MNLTDLNTVDIKEAEALIQTLFEGSGISTAEGSTPRELLIKPAAVIHAWQKDKAETLLKNLDLKAISKGDIAGDDDIVDLLAATYRVERRSNRASTGSIAVYLTNNAVIYINSRYAFYIGNHQLIVKGVYTGVPSLAGYNDTEEITYVPIRTDAQGRYYIIIPVTVQEGGSYSAGHPVEYAGSLAGIEGVYVFSDITGGADKESNKSLATRILQGLAPGVLSTPVQIRGAFEEEFGVHPYRVAVFGAMDREMRRAKDPLTSLPLPGCVDVVVMPSYGVITDSYEGIATRTPAGKYELLVGADKAAGAYTIENIQLSNGSVVTGSVALKWGYEAPGSHIISNGRYTAYQTCIVSFEATVSDSTLTCSYYVKKTRGIDSMQQYIDSSIRRAPGQDTIVRAAVPCLVTANIAVEARDISVDTIKEGIIRGINELSIGKGTLSGQDIIKMLPKGVELVFPLSLEGTFILPGSTRQVKGSQGVLTTPDWQVEGLTITSRETGFYTDSNNVWVHLNG